MSITDDFQQAISLVRSRIEKDRRSASSRIEPLLAEISRRLFDEGFNVKSLERSCKLDSTLRKLFRVELGLTPKSYLIDCKMDVGAWLLRETRLEVWRIGRFLGHRRTRNFSQAFRKWSGVSPGEFRSLKSPPQGKYEMRESAPADLSLRWRACIGVLTPQEAKKFLGNLEARLHVDFAHQRTPLLTVLNDDAGHVIAEVVWDALSDEPYDQQKRIIKKLRFNSAIFFDFLSQKSLTEGRKDRRRGVQLAELALVCLEGTTVPSGSTIAELRALGWARLGDAHRLALDYSSADNAFSAAEEQLAQISPEHKRHAWVKGEVLQRKGTLQLFQRKYAQAEESIAGSIALCQLAGHSAMLIKALIQRATLADYFGDHRGAVVELQAALRILKEHPDAYVEFVASVNLATSYCWAGKHDSALRALSTAREKWKALDPASKIHHGYRLQWIEGSSTYGLGNVDSAKELLRSAYIGFKSLPEFGYASIVALELAQILLEQNNFDEVYHLVSEVVPILVVLDHHPEVVVAIGLLRAASAARDITLATLQQAHGLLLKQYRQPGGFAGSRSK